MVYISGHNIISSLGFSSSENFKNINKNITGIKLWTDNTLSPEPAYVSLVNSKKLDAGFLNPDSFTKYEKLLISSIKNALKNSKVDIKNKKTVLIISTTKGNINLLNKKLNLKFENERVQLWKSSEIIKEYFKNPNQAITISNACISGALAIIVAKRLIDSGKFENAIVSGADILPEFTLSGFQAFKAVSDGPCKPFDANRTGMTPGEGAGTVILTNDKTKALKPLISILGGTSSNDANHISGPSRTGKELAIAISKSFKEANLLAKDIDYVSAHGTATLFNDEMEAKALSLTKLNLTHTNSFKGYLGHTFGAAGIIETIFTINSLSENKLYKSLGFKNKDINEINIISENKNFNVKNAIKTASGFGGCNASLIVSKEKSDINNFRKIEFVIKKKIKLQDNRLFINDIEINPIENYNDLSFSKYAKALYKFFKIKYPKYYKMDKLSKLAFLASEILLKDEDFLKKYDEEDISVIISNGSSSLDTDAEYQKTIEDKNNYFPSPSVFVYTLANIMIGEICIRNKIKGENTVFISKDFNKEFIFEYVEILFNLGKAKVSLCGRIDYNYPHGNYIAELYLIEMNK